MKYVLLIILTIFWSSFGQTIVTSEDAIKIGLKNNFDIQIARNNTKISENNTGLGTAGFLPVVDVSGNYIKSGSDQVTNSPFSPGKSDADTYSGQVNLNWHLFDGFQMFIHKYRFDKLAELQQAQTRNTIENTAVEILRAYFNLVQQEQLLQVAKNTLEISEGRYEKEKVRRDVGGASSTDLLNAQVSYNDDRANLVNQELQVVVSRKDLNILLGQNPATKFAVEENITLPVLSISVEEIFEAALNKNSFLLVARTNKKIAHQNVKLARASFAPNLLFNANYGYSNRTASSNNINFPPQIETNSTDKSIGLSLSWNLFNGFRNKIDLQNSKIELKNSELFYKNAQNVLNGLVLEKYETYLKRMELVHLEEQNVQAAQQNLQLQQDRYQIGTASSLEFRDAQINLARAQNTLIGARYYARISHLEIEQLMGSLHMDS